MPPTATSGATSWRTWKAPSAYLGLSSGRPPGSNDKRKRSRQGYLIRWSDEINGVPILAATPRWRQASKTAVKQWTDFAKVMQHRGCN